MPHPRTCPNGHTWTSSDDGPAATCPVCGEIVPAFAATTLDAARTVLYAPDAPAVTDPDRPDVPGYTIEGVLGRGGMGVVYKATQVALKRPVALKMIRGPVEKHDRDRFRAEAEAVARLQHPNIVQIHEVGEYRGQPFFSLEYVPGGSLADRLADSPLPPREAATLVETLASAVQAAHELGIVHRDLKPANILLNAERGTRSAEPHGGTGDPTVRSPSSALRVPKVTDFGLAKRLDEDSGQTQAGQVMGTPSYMAPEQAAGKGHQAGPATDVYALGAILYECLTGRPPFQGATTLETLDQVRGREPVPPSALRPTVPRDVETVCLKCLEKDPGKRYPTARALADDLRRFLDHKPIRARPVGPAGRAWRWGRRNPWVAGLAAALAGVLVAGLVTTTLLFLRAERNRGLAERHEAEVRRNLDEVSRQREEVSRQREEAARQRDRAQASYRMARAALEDALRVRDDPRLKAGPLEDLQQTLARAEAGFYEAFLQLQGDDPAFQAERARAFAGLSSVHYHQGKIEDALRHARSAVEIGERLWREFPAEGVYGRELARAHTEVGLAATKLGRLDETERAEARALAVYQELLARDPADDEARDAVATAEQNLGVALRGAGRIEDGVKALRRALVLHEQRAASRDRQVALGLVWANLAEFYSRLDNPTDAADAYDQARAIWEELVCADPDDETGQLNMASVCNNYGLFLRGRGNYPAAAASWEKAIDVFGQLADRRPTQHQYRHALAMVHDNLGMLLVDRNDRPGARRHYDRALALWSALHAENPAVVEYTSDLGCVQRNLGDLDWRGGSTRSALDWYAKAIATLQTSSDRDHPGTNTHSWLRDASYKRATLLAGLRRHAESIADWDRVVELENGSRAETRLKRADALARAGQHARAVSEVEFLAGLPKVPPQALVGLAAVLAQCLPAVRADSSLTEADRTKEVDRLAARAADLLRRGTPKGAGPAGLEKNPDLEPLRTRPEFQKLVGELKKKDG